MVWIIVGSLFIDHFLTEGMRAYFEQFGIVQECSIMKDPTGRSRCFGFVCYEDPAVLDVVLQKIHILDKKQVRKKPPKLDTHSFFA